MRIAITGGTGFIGSHLARRLVSSGHELVLLARSARNQELPQTTFVTSDMSDPAALAIAFHGCDAVAHCAGINREIGSQTYERVHINATRNVMDAARTAGVRKVVLMSFLRARPDCGSAYHESKWAAEEIVRQSGLNYTIVRAGVVYGRGDHMLNHISHALYTFPVFALVGFDEKPIRPLAIEDLVSLLKAALIDDRMSGKTVAVTGAEQLTLRDALERVARVLGRPIRLVRAPVMFHYLLARVCEWTMKIPLVSEAQVRILTEGVVEPALPCDPLPYDLRPTLNFTEEQIRNGLPEPGPFGLSDLRWCSP
jgi:NADH dehydrogenase